jgi:hypothetical protein
MRLFYEIFSKMVYFMLKFRERVIYRFCRFKASSAPCPHVSGHYMHASASLFMAEGSRQGRRSLSMAATAAMRGQRSMHAISLPSFPRPLLPAAARTGSTSSILMALLQITMSVCAAGVGCRMAAWSDHG